jgi:hypothetical protein
MERIAIVSILTALLVPFTAARATEDGDYKKICRVSENLKVLADSDDANSCGQIAVGSQAQEYQIGCRDSDNNGTIIVTTPFGITDKAARVTTSKLAANTQNTATPEQICEMRKGLGESVAPGTSERGSQMKPLSSSDRRDVAYWALSRRWRVI